MSRGAEKFQKTFKPTHSIKSVVTASSLRGVRNLPNNISLNSLLQAHKIRAKTSAATKIQSMFRGRQARKLATTKRTVATTN